MIRSILVPLDGSTFGEHALPLALDLARRAKVTLHLVQVVLPVGSFAPEAPLLTDNVLAKRLVDQQKAAQQQYLDTVGRRLTAAGAPRVQTWLLDGDIPAMIRQQAETVACDLIVMTTHGRGTFARFWLGSVADELVRTSSVPVLLVRPGEESPDLEKPPPLRHLLLPLDGSPLSEQIVAPAMNLGELTGADYTLMRVVRPPVPAVFSVEGRSVSDMAEAMIGRAEEQAARQRAEAEEYLVRVAGPLRERGLTVLTRVEVVDSPATAILRGGKCADLIALATHGRKGLKRLFLGSVADKLIRGSTGPVLVYRPRER
jgi:nucleotide-binding universal stress UspA family protein